MTKAAADLAKAANVGSATAADVSAAEAAAHMSATAEPAAVSTTEAATVSTSTARKRISGQSGGESDSRRQDDHGFT